MEKSRKILSPSGLISIARNFFIKKFAGKDALRKSSSFPLPHCFMACLAIFHLKFPSLLKFEERRGSITLKRNLKNIYGIAEAPSDTTLRETLDNIHPKEIRGVFKEIFASAQRGKMLEPYQFWEGHYLVASDATQHYSSNKVQCQNCCTTHHQNGAITYHHQMLSAVVVHPDLKQVIPFAPEPITNEHDATKNDCEQNAARRLLKDLRREHPHLKMVITEDSLYPTGPHIKLLKELDMHFIIGAKPGNTGALFDWVKATEPSFYEHGDREGNRHKYSFINNVPLNDSNEDIKVNFLEYWQTDKKGKVLHFSWVTSIPLDKSTVELVMRGGRARWRIENETFNTLKNQGYHFEHNYGHGNKNLCSIMGMLMMLVFLIDQIGFLTHTLFQRAKAVAGSFKELWGEQRYAIRRVVFESLDELYIFVADTT